MLSFLYSTKQTRNRRSFDKAVDCIWTFIYHRCHTQNTQNTELAHYQKPIIMKRSLLQVEPSRSCPSNEVSLKSLKKQRRTTSCQHHDRRPRRRRVSFAATPVFVKVEQSCDGASITDDDDEDEVDGSDHAEEDTEDTTTVDNNTTTSISFPTRQAQEGCPSIFPNVLTLEEIERLWYNEDDLRRAKQRTRYLVLQQHNPKQKQPKQHIQKEEEEESFYGLERYSWERSRHKKSALWYVLAAHSEYPHHPSFIKAVSERCTGWAQQVARLEAMELFHDLYGDDEDPHHHQQHNGNNNYGTNESSSTTTTTTRRDVKVVGLGCNENSSSSSSPTIEDSSSSSVASLVSDEEEEQDAAAAAAMDVPRIVVDDDGDDDEC